MSVAMHPWTIQQFLEWENRQDMRFEFDGITTTAMAGGTLAHAAIQRNLISALTVGLRGKKCQPFGSELKIAVSDNSIRYPDAFVICSSPPPSSTVVHDPVVVFEILSESSATTDFVVKNAEYRDTPSVQRYVVLQQTKAAAVVFSRQGGAWVTDLLTAPDAELVMPEIDITIPLSDIYTRVEFDAEP